MKKIALATISLVAFGIGVVVLIFRGSDEAPDPVTTPKREPEAVNRAGWYELDNGAEILLMPSARGGLFQADYANYTGGRMTRVVSGAWEWTRWSDDQPRTVTFDDSGSGRPSGFTWTGRNGTRQRAVRSDDPAYAVEEVYFQNSDLELSGLFFVPRSAGPHPGAVFIHGSGLSDRDNLWYQTIIDRLVRAGVAVLLPDKRGTGKSDGNWRVATFEQFAEDTLAAHVFLKERPEIDASRVGLVGISQGGWIAPLAASLSEDVRFVVNVSGSSVRPNEQLRHESAQTLRQQGVPGFLASVAAPLAAAVPKLKRPTWWGANGPYDPIPYWQEIDVPALIVYGIEDERDNVPVRESVRRIEQVIEGGNDRLTLKTYPGSGHGLYDSETGRIREDFLSFLIGWVQAASADSDPATASTS